MAYEMVMPYHLHMPSYFLETFTEYPFLAVTFDFYRKWPLLRFIICSFNECGKGIYVFLFGLSWIYLENESVRIKKMEFS